MPGDRPASPHATKPHKNKSSNSASTKKQLREKKNTDEEASTGGSTHSPAERAMRATSWRRTPTRRRAGCWGFWGARGDERVTRQMERREEQVGPDGGVGLLAPAPRRSGRQGVAAAAASCWRVETQQQEDGSARGAPVCGHGTPRPGRVGLTGGWRGLRVTISLLSFCVFIEKKPFFLLFILSTVTITTTQSLINKTNTHCANCIYQILLDSKLHFHLVVG